VVKNKVAPPFKTAEFDILYNQGISHESEIISLAVQLGFIEKSGAWYSYKNEKIGQGKENVRQYLKENQELANKLEQQIRAELLPSKEAAAKSAPAKKNSAEILDD
jgi:recombination protein RecA